MKRGTVRWGTWLLGVLVCGIVVARATIVTDITAFLPGPATREQAMLAEQLRDGVASRVILIGIEAASADQAAAAAQRSQQVAATLRADPRFAFVANGDPAMFIAERDRLFDARYLLSAQVSPQRFSVEGLRTAAADLESLLRSSAAPLVKPTAARDLTGELLSIAAALKPARAPISAHGVWFDPTGRTALLLATTRAPGFDVDAQAEAVAAIRAAFGKPSTAETLQLHLTGPGVFAVESRRAIRHDAQRLTVIAAVAVSLLLLLVLRSPRFLLWAALPTATGALAGLAAVAVAFGTIHGITLGFGLTLIGEAVDYAIYVQVQRQRGDNRYLWRDEQNAVLWRGLWLAMLTSSAGFVAMMLSGFAGLMQLGLMSIVGIAVAASMARFCLPDVLQPLDAAHLTRFAALARFTRHAPRLRVALLLIGAASVMLLMSRGDRLWNDRLAAISPLARGSGELDARLRSDTGLGDLRFVIAIEGATKDEAIARAEALHDRLTQLSARGVIAGFDSPATLVPSTATQRARRAALPDAATLRERVTQALANSTLRAEAFEPFIADVQRARELTIGPDYYAGTALGQRLAAQLVERKPAPAGFKQGHETGSGAVALITLTGVGDAAAVAAGVRGVNGVSLIDLTDVQALVADYRARAVWAALGGGVLIVLILAVQLRNLRATARIAASVAVSMAITAAALVLIEEALTLFHLVALLLAAGVGTNYALFIGMPRDDQPAESGSAPLPVILSVTLAAGTTLIAFATLAMSATPVLHMIGETVAIGATVALVVSMALAPERARKSAAA
jgi:predicted exporter